MADEFHDFVSHLTDNARTSLQHAEAIARGYGSQYIGTEHILLGVLAQGSSIGAKVLGDAGVTLSRTENALQLTPRRLVVRVDEQGLSQSAQLTMRMSWELAQQFGQEHLGTEHLLYSMLSQSSARATMLLGDMDVDVSSLKDDLESYFERQQSMADEDMMESRTAHGKNDILAKFGVDMTRKALREQLDPVIGRDNEVERMVTILSRRTKNNPLLIGEPGVGKTAIVEGLARRIVSGAVPPHLLDKRVIQLDLTSLIAGTKYRGEFEGRIRELIDTLREQTDVILFIDEIHLLVGAGAAEGALDAANILKPALARGEIRLIGATTIDEFRTSIEKDQALTRRFQTIMVREPSLAQTRDIMLGIKERYEKHHSVAISNDSIDQIIDLSDRYITNRFMPDKAIDVLDEAAALARVQKTPLATSQALYNRQLRHLNDKIEAAVQDEDYERAALYKTRLRQLEQKIDEQTKKSSSKAPLVINESLIRRAVAVMTGLPVERLARQEKTSLRHLETHLNKSVKGQREAVGAVARAVRRARSGISHEGRPLGSFIFVGPTGVGKTELARALAREVFGGEDSLIKIDMSEYSEKHTASRLLGAPAGYVGYEDGGKLTEAIRAHPYSVVLFDEVEKAHPDIYNLLLQILEDGKLTDAHGKTINFQHTIVILTSNVGAERMMKESSLGFHQPKHGQDDELEHLHTQNAQMAEQELGRFLRPELLNRFDEIITFRSLSKRTVSQIFTQLFEVQQRKVARQGYQLNITAAARRHAIGQGFSEKYGVRPLRRVIQNDIGSLVADVVLDTKHAPGSVIEIVLDKNGELDARVA